MFQIISWVPAYSSVSVLGSNGRTPYWLKKSASLPAVGLILHKDLFAELIPFTVSNTFLFCIASELVEDVLDLLLNLKRLVLKVEDQENHTLTVKAKGPGDVLAAQIQCPAGVEVVNTDLKVCTLSDNSTLDMEVSISHGVGYRLADKNKTSDSSFIPIDSIFSPIIKVSYGVSPTQVGQVTDYDKLTLDVETDGSIDPSEAISSVGKTLGELWKLFADIDEGVGLVMK